MLSPLPIGQSLPREDFAADPPAEAFRSLVACIEDYAIFMLDARGRVMSWNAGARRIKGYTAHEIIGRSFEVFYPPDSLARNLPREGLRLASEQGRFEDEGWRLRKDGTRFWASIVITALRDEEGKLTGFAKITRDLTERRRREEELRRSEEQLRLLVDAVNDYAIYLLDPEGRVRTWNGGASAIHGYTADEVLDRHFSMFFDDVDCAAGKPAEELASALRDGRAEAEGWRLRKDGSRFWANAVIAPVFDRERVLRGYAKVTRDLTDRRRLSELEQSSRRMNEFLAMLSHELRNPLAPIRNAVSVMQMQPGLPPVLGRVHAVIDRQLRHLTRLVDDLLELGRIATGKILLENERVEFHEIVNVSVEAVRPLVDARSQRLVTRLPDEPVRTIGDPVRFAQALQNLLHNAVRYTPPGGEIVVTLGTEKNDIVVSVSDNGRGIAPEALERIFELFVQEDAVRAPGQEGLGIGLSLARTLIEQHGGTLSASSAGIGHGSTFTMRVPQRRSSRNAPAAPAVAPTEPPARRVLVVDDNRDSADTMVCLLSLLGHEARGVYGAEQALCAVEEFQPQVMLLDLNMPDGDGVSVMKRVRMQSRVPVYIAAMTGYGQANDRRRTLEAGFQAHLTKPVQPEQLRQLLREAASVAPVVR